MPAAHVRGAAALFGVLFGLYLLTSGGHFYAVDEEMMFDVTESLALHGSFALNPSQLGAAPTYSQYGPGQSVAALPLFWLGRAIAGLFSPDAYPWLIRAIVSWFNPLITAAVAALLLVAVLRLGFGRRVAIGTALLYGLGTMAWPHSKTFFAEPLTALLFFGSYLALPVDTPRDGEPRERAWRPFLLAGLLAGLAPTVKIQSGIALPLLALFAALRALRATGRQPRAAIPALAGWAVGAALPLGALAIYQQAAFGSPFRSGYGDSIWSQFSTDFWVGFGGQIWSSGRGILWYAPPLLLFPIGLWLLWRRDWQTAALCALIVVAHVLFYSKWIAWDGAGAWGPRFLNAVLPFMALPLAAFLDTLHGRRTPLRSGALIVLALLAAPVQLAGLLISVNTFFSLTRGDDLSNYRVADSAIAVQLRIAADQLRQLYQIRFAPDSVALVSGFSYSEDGPRQVPRWTRPQATIALRPPPGEMLELDMELNSCFARPAPSPIAIAVAGRVLARDQAACPMRRYRFALPARPTTLTLSAAAWNPAAFGGERDEELGVMLQQIAAQVDGRPLALQGDTLPVAPMPRGAFAIRHWMGDHRMSHWDFWWWYLLHDRLSPGENLLLAAAWLALGLGSLGWGLRGILRAGGATRRRGMLREPV